MKNIMLIGFMGVGKTTIARALAKRLNRPYIDTDEAIEKELKLPTTEIFQKYGESYFREKEREYILQLTKEEGKVVSLGGGAFLQEAIRKACMEHCIVVYLEPSWETWRKRIDLLRPTRPILQKKSEEEIRVLFEERKPYYQYHHIKIRTDDKTPEKIAKEIDDALTCMEK